MITKSFEISKINLDKFNLFLLYGENEGLKNEVLNTFSIKLKNYKKIRYDENEILENYEKFISEILNKSLFDEKKLIIINQTTDKSIKLIEELLGREVTDCKIFLFSQMLQKKSKLRVLFEKENNLIAIPFYNDNNSTLSLLAGNFFNEKKIKISQETINLLVERSLGDRKNLYNELNKIENFAQNGKKLTYENIMQLTNLAEDYSIGEITDNCLAKNIRKIIIIINENNFSPDECIIILRTLLYKSKRVLNLINSVENTNNIEKSISSYKPTIFWKEKDIVKKQINAWSKNDMIKMISEIFEIEMLIKKNSSSSLNIMCDFILKKSKAA